MNPQDLKKKQQELIDADAKLQKIGNMCFTPMSIYDRIIEASNENNVDTAESIGIVKSEILTDAMGIEILIKKLIKGL